MAISTSFCVRCSDVDKMGIAHHSDYLKWFEDGRRDYLSKAGISHSSIDCHGFYLPLSEMGCKYISPIKYGDKITVITSITLMTCVKVKFEYKIINKTSGKPLAFGKTVHAWTDKNIKPLNIEKAAPHIYSSLKKFSGLTDVTGDGGPVCIHEQ